MLKKEKEGDMLTIMPKRGNWLRMAGVSLTVLVLAGFVACTGKTKIVEVPANTTVASGKPSGTLSEIPHVEAPVGMPALTKGTEGVLLAYRHTGIGFVEANGYDTLIFRFLTLPGGWLSGCVVSERRLEGEKEVGRYSFSYAGNEIMVSGQTGNEPASGLVPFSISPGKVIVGKPASRVILLDNADTLTFQSPAGDYTESFMAGSSNAEKRIMITRAGAVESEGKFEYPEKGKIVAFIRDKKDTTGAEEVRITLFVDEKNDYRFRTEGVEPVNEVYASGLQDMLTGDHALENLALIDYVLGKGRDIRPVLAYAVSQRKSGK